MCNLLCWTGGSCTWWCDELCKIYLWYITILSLFAALTLALTRSCGVLSALEPHQSIGDWLDLMIAADGDGLSPSASALPYAGARSSSSLEPPPLLPPLPPLPSPFAPAAHSSDVLSVPLSPPMEQPPALPSAGAWHSSKRQLTFPLVCVGSQLLYTSRLI